MKSILNWRLPTKDELNEMYENLHKRGIGRFASEDFWSSEGSSYYAWSQSFTSGYQYNSSKNYSFRVRAVRSFESTVIFKENIGNEFLDGIIFDVQGATVFVCKKEDEEGTYTWDEAMKLFKEPDNESIVTKDSKIHRVENGYIVTSKVDFISDVKSIDLPAYNDNYFYYKINEDYISEHFNSKEDCQADIDLLISKL